MEKIRAVFPDALAIALLGAIESLFCTVVADGMSGRRHRSNCELVAQGIGNIASVAFGGICVTGTLARTATNIRAGARGPVSGLFHSTYLLLFVLFAMPLVKYIPLASLAAVLVIVAWSMADKADFALLLRASPADAAVLLATFLLTIFFDLLTVLQSAPCSAHSYSSIAWRKPSKSMVEGGSCARTNPTPATDARNSKARPAAPTSWSIASAGPFFSARLPKSNLILDRVIKPPRVFIMDFADVPFIDITAARALGAFVRRLRRAGASVFLTGVRPQLRRPLTHGGLTKPSVRYVKTIDAALREAQRLD